MNLKSLLLAGLLYPAVVSAQTLRPEEIYQCVLPSVLTLQVENAQGEHYVGTAFLALHDGVAVTAWHVVSDATKVTARFADDSAAEVTGLVDKDVTHDLALVRVKTSGHPQARICGHNPMVGSRAYAIGSPKGFEFSITDGLVSQIQMVNGYHQFQVSCPISGGNSGGPIVNERGEVVGVTSWTKRDAQNLSFATPASYLSQLNPTRTTIAWSEATRGVNVLSRPTLDGAAPAKDNTGSSVEDLKRVLKESAGKRVTVTVRDNGEEKNFDIVVPDHFAD